MKSDISDKCEEIYTDCVQFCTVYEFQLPSESVRKRVRDQEAIESEQKEHYRLKYDTLLATIIDEIRERFDTHSYHLKFELIRCCNKTRRVDFEILKIYDKVIDFTKLEVEFQGFIFHKLQKSDKDWNSFDFTITYFFLKNGLRAFYPQVHLMIKLYLSIPIGSVENERSFSCLKILKNWHRQKMSNDRLSDL
jgi:hypothetical protein